MIAAQPVIDGGYINPTASTASADPVLGRARHGSGQQQQSRSEAMNETHSLASCRIVWRRAATFAATRSGTLSGHRRYRQAIPNDSAVRAISWKDITGIPQWGGLIRTNIPGLRLILHSRLELLEPLRHNQSSNWQVDHWRGRFRLGIALSLSVEGLIVNAKIVLLLVMELVPKSSVKRKRF